MAGRPGVDADGLTESQIMNCAAAHPGGFDCLRAGDGSGLETKAELEELAEEMSGLRSPRKIKNSHDFSFS